MKVSEFVQKLNMKVKAGEDGLDNEIKGCYICDLLSYVMGEAKEGDVWITVQTNINVAAVAALANVACVVVPSDIEMEENTLKKADMNDIPMLSTNLTAYEIACALKDLI